MKAAVEEGRLAPDRLESYLRLRDELAELAQRKEELVRLKPDSTGKTRATVVGRRSNRIR